MSKARGGSSLGERVSAMTWWQKLLLGLGAAVVLVAVVVLAAKGLRSLPAVRDFVTAYPGEATRPEGTPEGFPAWLRWQHYLNFFFMVLIVRSGWRVRTVQRPEAYWTPKRPKGAKKVSIDVWLHQSVDILWLLNGLVFFVLLFATGQWKRIVPTGWDVFPNALSAGLQYASLDWPTEDAWVSYNGLQLLTYFVTVFIAAPLAALSGWRMSTMFPSKAKGLARAYPIEWARAVHFPVMLYFVLFVIVHVVLVASTGLLRNLNYMFWGQPVGGWAGFWVFVAGLVVAAAAVFAARPALLGPVASLTGKVSRR